MAKRGGHDAGIGNDHVEWPALREQTVGAGAHALQAGKIQLDEFKGTAMGRCRFPHLGRGAIGFRQIARGTDDVGSMRHKRSCGFHSQACGNPGNEDAFAPEIHSGKNFVCRGTGAKSIRCHLFFSCWPSARNVMAHP